LTPAGKQAAKRENKHCLRFLEKPVYPTYLLQLEVLTGERIDRFLQSLVSKNKDRSGNKERRRKMATGKEKLIQNIRKKAHEYDKFSGCSQSVLLSIQEGFGMKNLAAFKSATVFGGGVARSGETCGSLIGALMAFGLVIGREKMEDTEIYRKSMEPARKIQRRFKEELKRQLQFKENLKTSLCKEIQKNIYGRSFDMNDRKDYQAFLDAGGHGDLGCPRVCAIAAQVAAEEIFKIRNRVRSGRSQHRPTNRMARTGRVSRSSISR
jgi:C_GCAxxG_C_C family probable redox protein